MKRNVKFIKCFWMLLLPTLLLMSCSEESAIGDTADNAFVLTLNVPDINRAGTKALTDDDEYKVTEVDLLVFDHATQKFLYYARGLNQIEEVAGTSGVDRNVRFKVMLYENPEVSRYDMVVLANARQAFYSVQELCTTSSTKDEIQQLIKMTVTPGAGWISTNTDAAYKAIPMWGEMNNKAISRIENYQVPLLRMLAKIDLSVALDPAKHSPTDEFNILQVKLYNYSRQGYVIPQAANMGVNQQGKPIAEAPSVPTSALAGGTVNAIDYSSKIVNGSLVREIYTFESPAGTSLNYQNNICLVFQGEYKHDGITEIGWYRLDFANTTEDLTANYLSIKRNHRYGVLITMISGRGLDTEEDAFRSMPVNIENEVIEWNDGGLNDVMWSGQYYIKFSDRKVSFNQFANPSQQQISIETNAPDLSMSDFLDQTRGAGDGVWNEIATDQWSNGHFTVRLNKNTIGADGILTATLTITAIPTVLGDPMRTTEFFLKGTNIMMKLLIEQDIHNAYLLRGTPDPQNSISLDGATQRVQINVESTLPYLVSFDDDNIPSMLTGVYTTSVGGSPLNLANAIPQTIRSVWIELSSYALFNPRIASFNIHHQDPLSTASLLSYNLVQVQTQLDANVLNGGISQKIRKGGGSIDIVVTSNLSKWIPILWVDDILVSSAILNTYLDRVTGSGNMIVRLTVGPLPGNKNRTFKLEFKNETGSIRSQGIYFDQKVFFGESVDRITIEGSGENAKLIITQNPNDAGLLFKRGSIVGLFSDHGENCILPMTGYATDVFHSVDLAFNPTNTILSNYDLINFVSNSENIDSNYHHNLSNVLIGKGDPCRLVGYSVGYVKAEVAAGRVPDNGIWRLPTENECKFVVENSRVAADCWWPAEDSPFGRPGVAGMEVLLSRNKGGDGNFFPETPIRETNSGRLIKAGYNINVCYRSASANSGVVFNSTYLSLRALTSPVASDAMPIRCVRQ